MREQMGIGGTGFKTPAEDFFHWLSPALFGSRDPLQRTSLQTVLATPA